MQPIQAIVFDLDGTLLDSAPDIGHSLNLMLADLGRPPLDLTIVKSLMGEGTMELCRLALEETGGVDGDDVYPYVKAFIQHYRKIKPDPSQIYPHTRETLEMLVSRGIKVGLCTNKAESATNNILKQLDLARYFGFVAGGDTFPVHKPDPAHITGVLDALQAANAASVFVGDGPRDVVASFRAGIPCIVVTHGRDETPDIIGETAIITEFNELERAIGQLGFGV